MFSRNSEHASYMDLSPELRDPQDWNVGTLRSFDYPLDISALAIEPLTGLLAIGTSSGVIFLFGGPGVESRLTLPEPLGVKFLQFATSSSKIVCLDDKSQLHVWDLSVYGRPKFLVTARFDPTNCLTLSPSHTHAFLASHSGEIRTYDLTCLRKSPYSIPNMWRIYEQKIAASGMPEMSIPTSRNSVETVIHPRDLNLLFLAYEGGVILADLTQNSTFRAYELVLPPGAPGGAGYGGPDILTHRRPAVTTLTLHPSGHFFAVGYADGSVAFWAVEDEDQPLLVMTLDTIDVNVVDGDKLEVHLSQATRTSALEREPIFKLSWSGFSNSSDPRGGESALTILGGLTVGEAAGLTVLWLPAFNPPEPPALNSPGSQVTLHPLIRTAMRDSLKPLKSFFYYTPGIIQDYLLVPTRTPHFSGTYDPRSILVLLEGEGDTRVVDAYQFPPPGFLTPAPETAGGSPVPPSDIPKGPVDSLADDLAATLKSLEAGEGPDHLRLPTSLWNGATGLLNGRLMKLEREIHQELIGAQGGAHSLGLSGGVAWTDETQGNELKLSKYQPNRILITFHRDLTVQLFDISAQLLLTLRPTPIEYDFPRPLPDLTIDLKPVLIDSSVSRKTSPTFVDYARIDSVQLTPESLEGVVVLQTGELIVYRLTGPRPVTTYMESSAPELVNLEHVVVRRDHRFSPYFMLATGRGPVTAFSVSDIGFLASAYPDGSLFVVDMRGPRIIFRHEQDKKAKQRHSVSLQLGRSESLDPIGSLTWTVSPLEKDSQLRVRLVAVRLSGLAQIFTLSNPGGPWSVSGDPAIVDAVANPLPQGSFVLDSKTGGQWKADRGRLSASLSSTPTGDAPPLFVTVGAKGVRCLGRINGERISKADWGSRVGNVEGVQVVERMGSHALVAVTDRHEALVYSLPHLEHLHTLQLPQVPCLPPSIDESGDIMIWTQNPKSRTIQQAIYGSLFNIRRAYSLPDIEYMPTKPAVPAQPQPVSVGPASLLNTWFKFGGSLSGDQVDALLGGPDRPIPEPESQPGTKAVAGSSSGAAASGAAGYAATAASIQDNLYNRLTSAFSERGQVLGDLEERFNSLEEGSRSMVAQAKRLAGQQTAKAWFNFR